jgi:hypothetical protein
MPILRKVAKPANAMGGYRAAMNLDAPALTFF